MASEQKKTEKDKPEKEKDGKVKDEKVNEKVKDEKVQDETELHRKIREKAKKDLGLNSVTDYNVGVCGMTGTGKSSLINGIRGIQLADQRAAPVDVTECTDKIDKYEFEKMPRLKLWDVPGAGTLSHPAEHYFEQKFLFLFDYLLIVIGNRLTEYDMYFAEKAILHGVQFAFVRSKSDQSVEEILVQTKGVGHQREATPEEWTKAAKTLQQKVRADMEKQLSRNSKLKNSTWYVVSAWAFLDAKLPQIDEQKLLGDVLSRLIKDRN